MGNSRSKYDWSSSFINALTFSRHPAGAQDIYVVSSSSLVFVRTMAIFFDIGRNPFIEVVGTLYNKSTKRAILRIRNLC